jgi:hypothetical protein
LMKTKKKLVEPEAVPAEGEPVLAE